MLLKSPPNHDFKVLIFELFFLQSRLHERLLCSSFFDFDRDKSISDDSGKLAVVDVMLREFMSREAGRGANTPPEKIVLVSNFRQVKHVSSLHSSHRDARFLTISDIGYSCSTL